MILSSRLSLTAGCILLAAACDSKQASTPASKPAAPAATATAQTTPPPTAPPAALAPFKTEMAGLLTWLEEQQTTARTKPDPAAANAMVGDFLNRAKALKTEQLPTDLKEAWTGFLSVMNEVDALFKTLPKPTPGNPQALSSAMNNIQPQLLALQNKIKPLVTKLAETGKKIGIEGLEKLGPGGPNGPPSPRPPSAPPPPQ